MRLTAIILLVACLQVSARSYSQITLSETDAPLKDVFRKIQLQSGYDFVCTYEVFKEAGTVTIKVKNVSLEKALEECLKGKPLVYEIISKTIVVQLHAKAPDNRIALVAEPAPVPPVEVRGTVVNPRQEPLSDVSVIIKGTRIGTKTDKNGRFTLTAPDNKNIVLEISYVGFEMKTIEVGKQTDLKITMEETNSGLNSVVVVGYGTQKKANVLGSISTVTGADLTVNPTPNIAQAMMGRLSGVYIKNVNGQPGDKANVTFNIRGFGTPLIIIDGMPGSESDFERLNANDIESVSVLKDAATASVYGARAGNGVVLVKTKRGTVSAPVTVYQGNLQLQHFTTIPHWVNSWQDASMQNQANYNEGLPPVYTAAEIQKFKDGSDPQKYPNTDWWGNTIRKYAPQQQHNLSVRGGTEKVKYYISGGYFYQEAMPKANDTKTNSIICVPISILP